MAPYGNAFDFTAKELTSALKSMNKANLPGAGAWELLGLQAALKKPENMAMSEALGGPFASDYIASETAFSVPSGVLGGALNEALPSATMAAPSIEDAISSETYSGPKGVTSLTPAARAASVNVQGFNIPQVAYSPEELDAATRMVLAESSNIVNAQGGLNTPAAQAVADVIRNRVISEQFPFTVQGVLSQRNQFEPYGSGAYLGAQYGPENPNYTAVSDLVRGVLSGETAPVVGGAVNFGNNAIIQGRPTASQRTQNAFAQMGADPNSVTFYSARNPASVQQTFGVLPGARPVDFGASVQVAARPQAPVADLVSAMVQPEQARAAASPSLPPRTSTPTFIDRLATNVFGTPSYDTGPGILGGAAKASEMGTQILAGSQPQVVEPAAVAPPPVNRPTGEPTRLASLLIDRAIARGEDRRRRRRRSTTEENMQSDTIGGLLA
jgi:spore germination cell wall hydrolase CwlJ-like protein